MHLVAYLELTLGRICQIRPVSLAVVCEVQCACHVMCAGKLAMWGPCGQAPCKRVQRQKYFTIYCCQLFLSGQGTEMQLLLLQVYLSIRMSMQAWQ